MLVACLNASAQTAIPMATQPGLSYTATFDSIASWGNNISAGAGASHFSSVPIGGTATIPDPLKITTSSTAFVTGNVGGLYKDTTNDRMLMLVTGTANNSNAIAFDLYQDYTGVAAGSLSFDWATVFNGASTSNRTGTLKVYGSVDGVNFTELTAAEITITNYTASGGTVSNVALPIEFSNSATARLRFYYYNSAGGTSGSRPKIAIDNIKIQATGNICTTPAKAPTVLAVTIVSPTSVTCTFNPSNTGADEYLVVGTINGSLSSLPVDSTLYNVGEPLGDGVVVYRGTDTSFTAGGLDPQTTYTFYVFPLNLYCNGHAKYKTNNLLSTTVTTPAGPPCVAPASQPGNLQFQNVTASSLQGNFSPVTAASEYLVVASTTATLQSNPVDGTLYNPGDTMGGGTVIYRGNLTSFTATGLNHSTTYYFHVFSLNNYACSNGPAYLVISPLTGQQATSVVLPCVKPEGNASNQILSPKEDHITGYFSPFNNENDGYLVVVSTNSTISALPQDGMTYTEGQSLGGGTVVSAGNKYSFTAFNLNPTTQYHFYIFSYNEICIGGPLYKTNSYLQGSESTTYNHGMNYYFGNLHSHSSYSDGNKDSSSLTPADDYAYAKDALCMDFLGVSDHNHYTANDNPGMELAKYQQGLAEANTFNVANPGFLALYGMEWGVQTNGGHVLIYGIDQLMGWDSIGGVPNYDIYVGKSDYLSNNGLFRKVNNYSGSGAFATLAHPGWSDFQYLAYNNYNKRADSAIAGIAIESGPAFSTDTSYTNPASSLAFLPYYQQMLAKGYHIAPMIDHDNHNTTFGRTTPSRTAVIAPTLSETNFYAAMQRRRFYATQDCDTRADIRIYGQMMGTEMSHSFAPAGTVTVTDPTNQSAIPKITVMCGRGGSGIPATVLVSATGNYLDFTDHTLLNDSSAYYYADIEIDGKRTITAPIWYTRKDTFVVNNVANVEANGFELSILSNPAHNDLQLKVSVAEAGEVTINVYTIDGKRTRQISKILGKGEQKISVDLSGHLPGAYVAEVIHKQTRVRRKFVVQ